MFSGARLETFPAVRLSRPVFYFSFLSVTLKNFPHYRRAAFVGNQVLELYRRSVAVRTYRRNLLFRGLLLKDRSRRAGGSVEVLFFSKGPIFGRPAGAGVEPRPSLYPMTMKERIKK
jgi:hypothetical protein